MRLQGTGKRAIGALRISTVLLAVALLAAYGCSSDTSLPS